MATAMKNGTLIIAASTTPAWGKLLTGGNTVLIHNATTSLAFVRFATTSSLIVDTSDIPIPPGATRLLSNGVLKHFAYVVLLSGSGNVYFTRGKWQSNNVYYNHNNQSIY